MTTDNIGERHEVYPKRKSLKIPIQLEILEKNLLNTLSTILKAFWNKEHK